MAGDPVGSTWGPEGSGLTRYPIVARYGWLGSASQRVETPILAVHGNKDAAGTGVHPTTSTAIWPNSAAQSPTTSCSCDAGSELCTHPSGAPGYICKSLPGQTPPPPPVCRKNDRMLKNFDCASHPLRWETCSGEDCVDPHRELQDLVAEYVLRGTCDTCDRK
jgi:hypothetical protein